MKKLLASFLCFGLICGLGLSSIGCKKGDEKKPGTAEKKTEAEGKKAEKGS